MILYKYRGNSVFTDNIFTTKKVWLSNAAGLNDPFECTIQEIAKDWIDFKVKELKQAHLSGFVMSALMSMDANTNFYDLSPKQTIKLLESFKTKANFDEIYLTFREFTKSKTGHYPTDPMATFTGFDKQLSEAGIFSLSETSESQLMWSHYGEESKGIAIGFEFTSGSKLSDKDHCLKVNYLDSLPAFAGNGFFAETSLYMDEFGRPYAEQKISFSDPTFQSAISTKPTVWGYEKEWRYVEEKSGAYPLPGKIREVVFGLKCTVNNKKKYRDLVKENFTDSISFFEIQSIPNTNSIVKVQCEDK